MSIPSVLTVERFGRVALRTGDLDPIYVGLDKLNLLENDKNQLGRWLMAYWCFYHAGFASYASEQKNFWDIMMVAAENESPAPCGGRWPRGSERRHFRGQQGIRATSDLMERYPSNDTCGVDMLAYLVGEAGPIVGVADVIKRVKTHRGFGDWISFKVADMLDTNCGIPVLFDNATIFMFDTPVKGAVMACQHWAKDPGDPIRSAIYGGVIPPYEKIYVDLQSNTLVPWACDYAVARLIKEFADIPAPPHGRRAVAVQEVETVLCKWKSHLGGHYPIGKDTLEIHHGLAEWAGVSPTAKAFSQALPKWDLRSAEIAYHEASF